MKIDTLIVVKLARDKFLRPKLQTNRVYSGATAATFSTAETTAEAAAAPLVLVLRLGVCRVVFLGLPRPLFAVACFLGGLPLFFPIAATCTSNAKN